MIRFYRSGKEDIGSLVGLRAEMLREVNSLPEDHEFTASFIRDTESFFLSGDQTTILADDNGIIACATICYYDLLPTWDHPFGKRAHIMNVYTKPSARRQGIAMTMLELLIDEAKEKGVTSITLDAAENAEKLYSGLGFEKTGEHMELNVLRLLRDKINHTGIYADGGPHKCCCGRNNAPKG